MIKINRWYVVMERSDGKVEHLYNGDLPSFILDDMKQYIAEIEQSRNEDFEPSDDKRFDNMDGVIYEN